MVLEKIRDAIWADEDQKGRWDETGKVFLPQTEAPRWT
jgi:hypothetical protein